MARNRRQLAFLAVLVAVLAAVLGYRFWATPPEADAGTSKVRASRTAAGAEPGGQTAAPSEVRLDALKAQRPTPVTGERNLFRFKPKPPPPPPPPPPRGAATGGSNATQPAGTAGPPPPPPIQLKFIGVLETIDRRQKIAVLRDDRGVYEGREGDIIEGRYKILHIGVESIEMSYVDGRGRQTIRLTGQ